MRTVFAAVRANEVTVHIVTNTTNVEVQVGRGAEDNVLHDNRGTGNGEHDGHDNNPDCDNNDWARNLFTTVNQPCVAANGGSGSVPAAAFAAQSAAGTEQLSGVGRRPSALTGR